MEESKESNLIKVGSKAKEKYLDAIFFSIDKFDETVVRGLGKRQSKVLELKDIAEDIDGVEITETKRIEIDNCSAIEIHIRREDGK